MPQINTDKLLTTAQAAEIIGVSADTVKKYCQRGSIKALKIGWSWMIIPEELKKYQKTKGQNVGRPKGS